MKKLTKIELAQTQKEGLWRDVMAVSLLFLMGFKKNMEAGSSQSVTEKFHKAKATAYNNGNSRYSHHHCTKND